MHIDEYSFGMIVIDGRKYDSDVLIYPDGRIDDTWWREKGHRLTAQDIADLVSDQPEEIIVGTGDKGMMTPDTGIEYELEKQGVCRFRAMPTRDAVAALEDHRERGRVAACLHLTC